MSYHTVQTLRDRLDEIIAERPDLRDGPVEFDIDGSLSWRVQIVDFDNEGVTLQRSR